MTEQDIEAEIPGVTFAVSLNELEALSINAALNELCSIDCYDINRQFAQLVGERPDAQASALQLMQGLCNYHMDPDNAAEPFKPMMVLEGRRSLVPGDLCADQIEIIAEIAPSIENAGLRARLGDVAWTVQRRRQDAADLAVHAYCDAIEALLAGGISMAFENDSAWCVRAKEMAVRAARISRITRWQLSSAERTKSLISDLVRQAAAEDRGADFCRLAEVDLDHRLSAPETIAGDAERMVELEKYANNPDTRKWLLETASRSFRLVNDDNGRHRCIRGIAGCHEQKAEMADSAMLKSSCLQDAIEVLRQAPNTRDERVAIEEKLREVQVNIRDEMGSFSTEIDLSDLVDAAISEVSGQPFPNALLRLLFCDQVPSEAACRQQAEQHSAENPLQAMMPMQVYDSQGRVTFKSSGLDDENQMRWLMSFNRKQAREIAVIGVINPTKHTLADEHPVSVDAIEAMLRESVLIPPGHHRIFARGIAAFIQGENIDAASMLIPQLENTLRHALTLNGIDCTLTNENGLQSEATLSLLLNRDRQWKPELEKMFPDGFIHEIESLFSFAGGTAVRHEIAHGKMAVGNFWDPEVTYACWLILHLIALPMTGRWSEVEKAYYRATGEIAPTETTIPEQG
ncbi:DUF7380 domain-containing protein [Ruegeria sp.]|uniref:DUF7380 domain-containing protein n=1 Tax=Ruegeria sp. TaxID=1879320 RepID=UPI003B597034